MQTLELAWQADPGALHNESCTIHMSTYKRGLACSVYKRLQQGAAPTGKFTVQGQVAVNATTTLQKHSLPWHALQQAPTGLLFPEKQDHTAAPQQMPRVRKPSSCRHCYAAPQTQLQL